MNPDIPGSPPLVSVLMTAYNREQYISEAIESVLASSYDYFELIIVDDCSADKTVQLATEYMATDKRIQLHINQKNLGDYPNRNKAVSLAKGKYIMFCDSDDKLLPDGIAYCVNAMEMFPEAGIGMYYPLKQGPPFMPDKVKIINDHFFKQPFLYIGPGGTILQRKLFLSIGGYPEKYGPANDMYFNLKICSATGMVFLPRLFLDYRIHEGQEQNNVYAYTINNFRYLDDALSELSLGLTADQIAYLRKKNYRRFSVNLIRYLFRTKNFSATSQLWQKAGFKFKYLLTGIFHFD